MKTVNVGIIGLGHMGRLHMMDCTRIEGVRIMAVADQSKSAIKKAEALGVKKPYTDNHDLLNNPKRVRCGYYILAQLSTF